MLNLLPTAYLSKSLNKNNLGLGNVLYQLSSIICICKKYNLTFNSFYFNKYLDKVKNFGYNHHQKIFRNIDLSIKNENNDIELKEEHSHIYSDYLINNILENKDKNILIRDSYLQSIKYFIDYESYIQKLFEPDEEFIKNIKKKYPLIFNENQNNICIQMRLNWGYGIQLNTNFILSALEKIAIDKENVNLFVFSDNIQNAKSILSLINDFNIIFVENNKYDYEDLWMMSLIKNHIVCFSTFSWWGAFLNKDKNKKIIYSNDFSEYFCKKILGKKYCSNEIQDNIFPKNWIILNKNYIVKNIIKKT